MKSLRVLPVASLLGLAIAFAATPPAVEAATFRYRLTGSWDLVTDGTSPGWGLNPNNGAGNPPGPGLPGLGDVARINFGGAEVTVEAPAPEFERLSIGVDEDGTVSVNDSGSLTTTQDIRVGSNGVVDGTLNVNDGGVVNVGRILWVGGESAGPRGFLNVAAGGTVNVASHLWWGVADDSFLAVEAEVEIDGTFNQTGGILGLGTINAISPGGGVAVVNVNSGGEFNLNNIDTTNDGNGNFQLGSIQPGSVLNVNGTGRITLPGDFQDPIAAYRDAGRITGDGTTGNVVTSLEAAPEPGDFNEDGVVDAADYTVYRDNVGAAGLPNDEGLGTVGQQHYDLWESSFGNTAGVITVVTVGMPPAAVAAVPEPGTLSAIGAMTVIAATRRRRR